MSSIDEIKPLLMVAVMLIGLVAGLAPEWRDAQAGGWRGSSRSWLVAGERRTVTAHGFGPRRRLDARAEWCLATRR